MRTKINKLKEALIANGENINFTEVINGYSHVEEYSFVGYYKGDLIGCRIYENKQEIFKNLTKKAERTCINLLKEFDLWNE
jgi:hypothetical protein